VTLQPVGPQGWCAVASALNSPTCGRGARARRAVGRAKGCRRGSPPPAPVPARRSPASLNRPAGTRGSAARRRAAAGAHGTPGSPAAQSRGHRAPGARGIVFDVSVTRGQARCLYSSRIRTNKRSTLERAVAGPAPARRRAEAMRLAVTRVHPERPMAPLTASRRGRGKRAHALGRAGRSRDGWRVVRILLRAS
jgi:hypothetical protein